MKPRVRIKKSILFMVLVVIFTILSVLLYIMSTKTRILEALSYVKKSKVDYQVCLRENSFYAEKCQPKDMGYIASAIDDIDIVFDYNFETTTDVTYNYEYYIDGIITVFDRNDSSNILFNKTVRLLDNKKEEAKDVHNFNINEKLKIDYHKYNDLVKSFKYEYNISADSHLKLRLYVKTNISYDSFSKPIETNDKLELTIPLTENTISINMNYKEIDVSDKFTWRADKNIMNKISFLLSMTCAGLSVVWIILLCMALNKSKNRKSEYEKFISNKIKNLDRMIISAKDDIKIDEADYTEIIDVKNFTELVDIAERLVDAITWTEVTHPDKKVSWFTVTSGKRLYRIVYSSVDVGFK